ncbi:splicing factor ESS-2 homolog [Microcaecilia unicolor]|uniref:Splicing factor ESS-2 homolog n=1 Tax=Microcaecilia unicolor TaxID=1415580 RepID=A0A6P7ZAF5_9AMPH|nr:splicing factor ESS-2 homolog [Microcaecilia unicolor]XP_030073551.1 splicing factor ESS-2 homolog [Microcaecilia unicolor]
MAGAEGPGGSASPRVLVPARVGTSALALREETERGESPNKKILDEETYIENLQKIIQRDFFPDMEKLRAQKEYLEAEESGDLEKMRQIAIKFGSSLGKSARDTPVPYVTPATFETPEVQASSPSLLNKHRMGNKASEEGDVESAESAQPLPGLDSFLAKHTSEDNASFEQIMEVAKEKERSRNLWLYEAEEAYTQRHQQNLALPSAEQQAIESGKAGVETWEYKAKNSLMYYPAGVPDNDDIFKKPREVIHRNTHFQKDPFSQALSKSQLQQAAALNAQYKQGKVGPDGKELIPQESPKVNGYGFVATPSPSPGVTDSPLMTWGEIESTPFRLDGSDTPYVDKTPGPAFKILEPGRRERLGLKMANEAAAKNRAKKQEALRRVTENLASLTPKGLSPALSPALQRLVNRTANKYTDKALRASYTPSPVHTTVPAGGPQTPTVTPAPRTVSRTPVTQDPTSLTDNLLQLPKRRKASDFF